MKVGATLMAGTALAASFGLHLAGFTMMPSTEVQVAGGAEMQLAMLGNSFVDMSEGAVSPVPTERMAERIDETEPVQTPPPQVQKPVTLSAPPITPQVSLSAVSVVENRSNPVVPLLTVPAPASVSAALQPPVETTLAVPKPKAVLAPAKPLETLKAEAPVAVQKAVPEARRPDARPKPAAARPKPPAPKRVQTATAAPKPQGSQAARKGQADGSRAGKAASRSRQGSRSAAAGNAAVSNYPGLVMRKISRIRKERAGARGKATVGFKVSASGAATSVRILRSSGSARVDRTAVRHIQRASPFARPPKGARRSFSVVFVSKR